MAFQQYFLDQATIGSEESQATISTLMKEGYIDQSFIDSLSKTRGVYFVYVPAESKPKGVSIQYFGEYGTAQMSASGDGFFDIKNKK